MKSVNAEHLRVGLGVIVWIIMIALSQESVAASGDAPFAAPAIHERAAENAPWAVGVLLCRGIMAPSR